MRAKSWTRTSGGSSTSSDRWARWVLERSHGGDPEQKWAWLAHLEECCAGVLRRAGPRPGETLLDVGAGDGLIGFGALPLVGDSGRVIFSDIPQDLLDHCRALASEMGRRGPVRVRPGVLRAKVAAIASTR